MTAEGKLYVVPTPVGNMEDITLRALRCLREADLVLAEDTRRAGLLLRHHGIENSLRSHHKFNEHREVESLVGQMLGGKTMALVSDAGTPGISDPGFLLVREAIRRGVEVTCLPGATAVVPALVMSGLPTDRFCFEGFLPVRKGRRARLEALRREERVVAIYESPRRVEATLVELAETLGRGRRVALVREISKLHEECLRGTLGEVADRIGQEAREGESQRVEFDIVVEGAADVDAPTCGHRGKQANDGGHGEGGHGEGGHGDGGGGMHPSKYRRKLMAREGRDSQDAPGATDASDAPRGGR